MQNVKISYIIPAYNCEAYIGKCVKALTKQDITSYEIIIINDGSTDGTASVCDTLTREFTNVKVIYKKNEGQGIARNVGIDLAKGDYIAFIDADDQPNWYSYGRVLLDIKNSNFDWIICGWNTFSESSDLKQFRREWWDYETKVLDIKQAMLDIAAGRNKLSSAVWNKIYNTDIIKNNNIRFKSERAVISEDFLFNCDYSRYVSRAVWEGLCLYHYRISNGSYCHKYQTNYYERLVQLKKELDTRYSDSEFLSGMYIKLYSFIKTCIIQEAQFKSMIEAHREIKRICKSIESKAILMHIDSSSLDKKNRLIYFLIKKERGISLNVMYKINNIFINERM